MPGKTLKPCGTYAAYRRHKRNGETPCAACDAAWAAYNRPYADKYAKKKATQK